MTTTTVPAPRARRILTAIAARLRPLHAAHPAALHRDPVGDVAARIALLELVGTRRGAVACPDCGTCGCGLPAVVAETVLDLGFCADHVLLAEHRGTLHPITRRAC